MPSFIQNTDNSARGAGNDGRLAVQKLARVAEMQTVNILFGVNGIKNGFCVHAVRQRHLNQNAVNRFIRIKLLNKLYHPLLRNIFHKMIGHAFHAESYRGIFFQCDIAFGHFLRAHMNDGNTRNNTLRLKHRHPRCKFRIDLRCNCAAVDYLCAHIFPFPSAFSNPTALFAVLCGLKLTHYTPNGQIIKARFFRFGAYISANRASFMRNGAICPICRVFGMSRTFRVLCGKRLVFAALFPQSPSSVEAF